MHKMINARDTATETDTSSRPLTACDSLVESNSYEYECMCIEPALQADSQTALGARGCAAVE